MTISLSLSLPGRKTGELSDPLFKTVRYFALRGAPNTPNTQDGVIPFFNIFNNPGGNKGNVYARVNVNDNGTHELWQDNISLGDASLSYQNSDGSQASTVEFGARVRTIIGNILLAIETASEQKFYLTDNDHSGQVPPNLRNIDDFHNFKFAAFIPSNSLFLFQDGTISEGTDNTYDLVARSEYTKLNAVHDLLNHLPNNQRTQLIVGQQQNFRPENNPPTGWATTVPDDPNNRGIVAINARLARNYTGGLELGPTSQLSDETIYYHIGGSEIRDFDPSGDTGAYGNEYGEEYN